MVDENTLGREPVTIVEIDQSFCSLTYGNAPCTAAVGTTGTFKCYNTRTTCQDPDNFTSSSLTLRFCTQSDAFPSPSEAELYLPIVESVSSNPTELNIGNGNGDINPLGRRASVTITMRDIAYNDARIDNYVATRGFNPLDQGTFWVKFLARNKHYQNRPLRVREGYIGQTVASMRTRNYIIEKISNADSSGRVTIVAKDILKLADDKRAQAPLPSTGVLDADISFYATTLTLTPSGIGNSDYPASGKAIIGSEIVSFTRSADVITLTERGVNNTTADDHTEGDTFQLCLEYTAERVDDVIYDLLTTYGNIDASYITQADWTAEADVWLVTSLVTTVITEPTGVSKLIGELTEQAGCFIWWDDVNQKIRFQAAKPVRADSIYTVSEDTQIIAETVSITQEPSQRISQVWIYYRMIDYTQDLAKPANFNKLRVNVDLDAESTDQYGESRIRRIFSRWYTASNDAETITLGSRILLAYRDNPIYIQFDLDAKDRDIEIADVIEFTHRSFVDFQGETEPVLLQIISREEVESGHRIRYKAQLFGFVGRFAFIMENTANDFDAATDDEKRNGGYICNNSGLMGDGSQGYKII